MPSDLTDEQTTETAPRGPMGMLAIYAELTKARLSALVLISTVVSYLLADRGPLDGRRLLWTLLGTALCAFGANALNQVWERSRDARMKRTMKRPLPSGRLGVRHALLLGLALSLAGPLILILGSTPLAALLALATVMLYVLVYTPLKPRSNLNTLVGAVVGAIPPLIGWTGATGTLSGEALLLGALLFLWQVPHFLALAWMYRDDYRLGGYRMLTLQDDSGRLTGVMSILYSLALLPLGVVITMKGISGTAFAIGGLVLGAGLTLLSFRLWRRLDRRAARQLFFASIIYLPLVLGLLVIDAPPRVEARATLAEQSTEMPETKVLQP